MAGSGLKWCSGKRKAITSSPTGFGGKFRLSGKFTPIPLKMNYFPFTRYETDGA